MEYAQNWLDGHMYLNGSMRTTNQVIDWLTSDAVWAKTHISQVDKEILFEFAKKIQEIK